MNFTDSITNTKLLCLLLFVIVSQLINPSPFTSIEGCFCSGSGALWYRAEMSDAACRNADAGGISLDADAQLCPPNPMIKFRSLFPIALSCAKMLHLDNIFCKNFHMMYEIRFDYNNQGRSQPGASWERKLTEAKFSIPDWRIK
jgi:hypothetical protein